VRSCNTLLRTAVIVKYAAATYVLYRDVHVNGETVEPVQRLLEKQTAGQAVPYFVVSEALLNCTYHSATRKKKVLKNFHAFDAVTPYLFQTQLNIIHIYPWKSLSFFSLLFSKSQMYKIFLFISYIQIPLLILPFGGARGGAVGWGTALQVGRSRVRFLVVTLEFVIDIILPATLWPWGWLSL
jgi:hypothetical protein